MARAIRRSHRVRMDNWKTVRLELAGTAQFPAGSVGRAYLIRLPLDDTDGIDEAAFRANPERATVHRFWSSEPDETGHLVRDGDGWAIACGDRPPRRLDLHGKPVRLAETLSIGADFEPPIPVRVASIR